jgi:hypothetical protein
MVMTLNAAKADLVNDPLTYQVELDMDGVAYPKYLPGTGIKRLSVELDLEKVVIAKAERELTIVADTKAPNPAAALAHVLGVLEAAWLSYHTNNPMLIRRAVVRKIGRADEDPPAQS